MLQYVLLLTILNGAHHFSQQTVQIELHAQGIKAQQTSILNWQLTWDNQQVISEAAIRLEQAKATVKFELPKVRARTRLQWQYQWSVDGKSVKQDQIILHVYPKEDWASNVARFSEMQVAVISQRTELGKLLTDANLKAKTYINFNQLGLQRPEYLLVDSQYASQSAFALTPRIEQLVRAGTQVVIFANDKLKRMTNLPVIQQEYKPSHSIQSAQHHPLLNELTLDDWLSQPQSVSVMQLSMEQPAQELVWLKAPPQAELLESLVAVEQLGKGRIIYWQLPLHDWQTDPRARQVLTNCLAYMTSPVTPTPSRKMRQQRQPAIIQQTIPTIHYGPSN